MTEFKIGDVVRLKWDEPGKLQMVVRDIDTSDNSFLCRSECSNRVRWGTSEELELIHRPDPQADLVQAIRKVLLSDEFMTAFAAAWMKTPLPIAMPCDDFNFIEPSEATNDPA